jgi:hypothetical protein
MRTHTSDILPSKFLLGDNEAEEVETIGGEPEPMQPVSYKEARTCLKQRSRLLTLLQRSDLMEVTSQVDEIESSCSEVASSDRRSATSTSNEVTAERSSDTSSILVVGLPQKEPSVVLLPTANHRSALLVTSMTSSHTLSSILLISRTSR